MKKIISLLIVVSVLCSLGIFSIYAEASDKYEIVDISSYFNSKLFVQKGSDGYYFSTTKRMDFISYGGYEHVMAADASDVNSLKDEDGYIKDKNNIPYSIDTSASRDANKALNAISIRGGVAGADSEKTISLTEGVYSKINYVAVTYANMITDNYDKSSFNITVTYTDDSADTFNGAVHDCAKVGASQNTVFNVTALTDYNSGTKAYPFSETERGNLWIRWYPNTGYKVTANAYSIPVNETKKVKSIKFADSGSNGKYYEIKVLSLTLEKGMSEEELAAIKLDVEAMIEALDENYVYTAEELAPIKEKLDLLVEKGISLSTVLGINKYHKLYPREEFKQYEIVNIDDAMNSKMFVSPDSQGAYNSTTDRMDFLSYSDVEHNVAIYASNVDELKDDEELIYGENGVPFYVNTKTSAAAKQGLNAISVRGGVKGADDEVTVSFKEGSYENIYYSAITYPNSISGYYAKDNYSVTVNYKDGTSDVYKGGENDFCNVGEPVAENKVFEVYGATDYNFGPGYYKFSEEPRSSLWIRYYQNTGYKIPCYSYKVPVNPNKVAESITFADTGKNGSKYEIKILSLTVENHDTSSEEKQAMELLSWVKEEESPSRKQIEEIKTLLEKLEISGVNVEIFEGYSSFMNFYNSMLFVDSVSAVSSGDYIECDVKFNIPVDASTLTAQNFVLNVGNKNVFSDDMNIEEIYDGTDVIGVKIKTFNRYETNGKITVITGVTSDDGVVALDENYEAEFEIIPLISKTSVKISENGTSASINVRFKNLGKDSAYYTVFLGVFDLNGKLVDKKYITGEAAGKQSINFLSDLNIPDSKYLVECYIMNTNEKLELLCAPIVTGK